MKKYFSYLLGVLVCMVSIQANSRTQNHTEQDSVQQEVTTYLFPVGGGKISDDFLKSFVQNSGKEQPRILTIPHAARTKSLPQRMKDLPERFRNMGYENVEVLDLSDPQEALQQIQRAEVIWMSGGGQSKLRKALERAKAGLPEAIREQYNSGKTIVGGTSAGAAIVSDVMISNTKKNKETGERSVVMSYGLKLWPEVIIDQHFSERKRMWRLEYAVGKHPNLIGVGIDESTGVLLKNKKEFTVIGAGTVTVYRATTDSKFEKVILKSGETYKF